MKDAESYNVYRSTTSGVEVTVGNRIAEGLETTYAIYLDTNVINDTTYYYRVIKLVGGVEVCLMRLAQRHRREEEDKLKVQVK